MIERYHIMPIKVDIHKLTDYHADRLARLERPVIRLALDSMAQSEAWSRAFDRLRSAGIAKVRIYTYALVGFRASPAKAWERCEWIESHGCKVFPMWFHDLDTLERNAVTDKQKALVWTDNERIGLMQWYYYHRVTPRLRRAGYVPPPMSARRKE